MTEGTAGPDAQTLAPGTAHCVLGHAGSDAYTTGTLDDVIVGGPGNDTLAANSGNDTLMGGDDDDTLYGGEGDDALYGGDGLDVLWGSSGTDQLDGGAGVDILHGGDGDDLLIGGKGVDSVYGDAGDDVAVIYDLCEIGGTGELIDGGAGYDILIAPVDATELAALGVSLVGIEKVIVDASKSHLSECGPRPPPKPVLDQCLTIVASAVARATSMVMSDSSFTHPTEITPCITDTDTAT